MCNKKLYVGSQINVEDITIVPVAQISREEFHRGTSVHFFACKKPAAIIVFQGGSWKVYDREGSEISTKASSSEDVGLREMISGVLGAQLELNSETK